MKETIKVVVKQPFSPPVVTEVARSILLASLFDEDVYCFPCLDMERIYMLYRERNGEIAGTIVFTKVLKGDFVSLEKDDAEMIMERYTMV